jgi:hypothetical protein
MRSLFASVVAFSMSLVNLTAAPVTAVDIKERQVLVATQVITVDTLPAKFYLNLPDIIRPGDRITGTAAVEPKGRTDAEKAGNLSALKQIGLRTNFSSSSDFDADWEDEDGPPYDLRQFVINIPKDPPPNDPLEIRLIGRNNSLLDAIGIPLDFVQPAPAIGDLPVVRNLFRSIGQQGSPHNVSGTFDGDGTNTKITINNSPGQLLAESPRGLVFRSPDIVGPVKVTINDNGNVSQGTYRNLGLQLSAGNLQLKKGESTTLTVRVTGLAGIREDVPIWMVKSGVVSMSGGDYQHYKITPGQIGADGTYVTTRTLTGLVEGGFGVTVTVMDPTWRPLIIPLLLNAPVNGFSVQNDGKGGRIVLNNVTDPTTGKPLDGKHNLDTGCGVPTLSKIPVLSMLFKNGNATSNKQDCLVFITPRIVRTDE